MHPPFLRRDEKFHPVGKEKEPHLVVVMNGAEGKNRSDFGSQFPLAFTNTSEIAGGADIQHDHHGHLTLFREFLDIRFPCPRGHIPVDGADLVAGRVGTHLLEVHPAPLEDALILPGKRRLHESPGAELEASDLTENLARIVHRSWEVIRSAVGSFADGFMNPDS